MQQRIYFSKDLWLAAGLCTSINQPGKACWPVMGKEEVQYFHSHESGGTAAVRTLDRGSRFLHQHHHNFEWVPNERS